MTWSVSMIVLVWKKRIGTQAQTLFHWVISSCKLLLNTPQSEEMTFKCFSSLKGWRKLRNKAFWETTHYGTPLLLSYPICFIYKGRMPDGYNRCKCVCFEQMRGKKAAARQINCPQALHPSRQLPWICNMVTRWEIKVTTRRQGHIKGRIQSNFLISPAVLLRHLKLSDTS